MNTLVNFACIAVLLFGFVGLIWRTDSWYNVLTKFVLLGMAMWGAFLVAVEHGYIVKI